LADTGGSTRNGLPVAEERLAEFGRVEPGEQELAKYRGTTLTLGIGGVLIISIE
jgi:hypothetical protein